MRITIDILPYCNHPEPEEGCRYCDQALTKHQWFLDMISDTHNPYTQPKLSFIPEPKGDNMNTTVTNNSGFVVGALLKVLTSLPQDYNVVLSSDEEGNDFGLLFRVEKQDDCIVLYPATGTVEFLDDDIIGLEDEAVRRAWTAME